MDNLTRVIDCVKAARRAHSLINVYQYHSSVFYTGYVYHLSDDGVVMRTFNEYGMRDGMAFVNFDDIRRVEFYSRDLSNIGVRIRVTQMDKLLEYTPEKMMPIVGDQNIAKQILGRSYVEDQMVMIEVNHVVHYLEGTVDHLGPKQFSFTAINKFDFSRHQQIKIPYSSVLVIEFQGKELTLLSQSIQVLFGKSIPRKVQELPNAMIKSLQTAQKNHQLVEAEAIQDRNYFYVGWVKSINSTYVILKVIDMAGQFGGYVLMRLDSLRLVVTNSDYLKLVRHCVKINQQQANLDQPVLDDQREFDPTNNLMVELLRQSLVNHRLVRLRIMGSTHSVMGRPSEVNDKIVVFCPVNQNQTRLEPGREIEIRDVQELVFDYLGTYLVKKELDVQKWR